MVLRWPRPSSEHPDVDGGWWKIRYNYGGTTQDTTTWEAHIEGNPVKLVE